MFNRDFTPKQKAFLNEKFSHLEAVLTKQNINIHKEEKHKLKTKITHTVVGQLKPVGKSVLKEAKQLMAEMKQPADRTFISIQQAMSVPLDKNNDFGGFNYRTLDDILLRLKPLLNKHQAYVKLDLSLIHI